MTNELSILDVLKDPKKDLSKISGSLEPDENYFNSELQDSHYFSEEEFLNFLTTNKISNQSHLKIISLNIANLLAKLSSLKVFLQNISNESNKPSIIAVTETHLNESKNHGYNRLELQNLLPGYKFFHEDRKNKRGGGVGIFIEDGLSDNAQLVSNNLFHDETFEGLTVKLPNLGSRPNTSLIILTLYRQPNDSNTNQFLGLLEEWLAQFDRKSNELVITGDMNLDLLKYESHLATSSYLDLMASHGLSPGITRPTRIKHSSASLIDHLFTKHTNILSGILVSELAGSHGYTDHYPIFGLLKTTRNMKPTELTITKKYFTTDGHRKRRDGLLQENWTHFYEQTDASKAYQIMHDNYCQHYYDAQTTRTFKASSNRVPKAPWMTNDILQKIRKRDRLSKIKERRKEYQMIRNEIVSDCRKAEKHYAQHKISENLNNIKNHWKVIKQIMGKTNNKLDFPSSFKSNGEWITDKTKNAMLMNKFYSSIGIETNQSVGKSKLSPEHFLCKFKPEQVECIDAAEFTEQDVLEACKQLNSKSSCDTYGLSQAVVIRDADIMAPMLSHLANCSIQTGTFPDQLKVARVIPVYKEKGEKFLYTNYRPISLLPAFSKILEKMVYNKLFHFLVRYQILFKSQFGFRKGHNTTHATLDFLKTIESALHDGEFAIGIFCDLSKAFDTLDHQILLKKISHYGIRGNWYLWLKSYLSNRRQYVDINGTRSEEENINVGVPQGSILGPLLFLLYINDLPASLNNMNAVMFADDTNLVGRHKNLNTLAKNANSDLESLSDYFKANKLKLNADKTKMVCFRKKGQKISEESQVLLDGVRLSYDDSATFLGITLDSHLTWEQHCTNVANKASRSLGILNRIKNNLLKPSRKIIYDSLVSSHLTYGLEVWGACQAKFKKRLVTIQKRCVRVIDDSLWNAHSEPRMKRLKILKFEDHFQCASLVYDMLKSKAPNIFGFTSEQNTDTRLTRSLTNNPSNLRNTFSKINHKSFASHAPDIWNNLGLSLQNAASRKVFKSTLKQKLLAEYNDKVQCCYPRCRDNKHHLSTDH